VSLEAQIQRFAQAVVHLHQGNVLTAVLISSEKIVKNLTQLFGYDKASKNHRNGATNVVIEGGWSII
jgi:hypothetical protein